MAIPAPSFTPRLRMTRQSPFHYDRSQVASESGPSRLPDLSQLVDVKLDDMASDTTEQPTHSRMSTTSTPTRPDNPAAVLRALLSRLPNQSSSPRPLSPQQYPSERESDYDYDEMNDATPASRSHAQESLRDIFTKARRDPDTPNKSLRRRNSVGPSGAEENSEAQIDKSNQKGKQRSFSDDESDQHSRTPLPNKPTKRSKTSPKPITKEFLRERFSNSYALSGIAQNEDSLHNVYDPSNESLLRELNSSEVIPPAATSTPQQSLRLSVNAQFVTNLLESDTEMQHVIEGLNSYGDDSRDHSLSPPPTIRRGLKTNTTNPNSSPSGSNKDLHRTPLQPSVRYNDNRPESVDHFPGTSHEREHNIKDKSRNVTNDYLAPPGHQTASLSSMDLTSPFGGAELFQHRSKTSFLANESHDTILESRGRERSNSESVNLSQSEKHFIGKIHSDRVSSSHSLNGVHHQSRLFDQQSTSSLQLRSSSGSAMEFHSSPMAERRNSQDNNLKSPHPSHLSRPGQRSSPRPYSPTKTNQSNDNHHSIPEERDLVKPMNSHPSIRQELSPSSSRRSLTPPPLQSISKKRPASPSPSTMSRNLKASPSSTSNGKGPTSLFDLKESSSRFMSSSPREESTHESSSTPRDGEDRQADETDELRDTDFSSRGGTPPIPLAQSGNYVDISGSSSVDLSQFPVPPSTPLTPSQDRDSLRGTSSEHRTTPATPPQRPSSGNKRREFRIPSPPQALPDLPTPSSSDESENMPTMTPRSDLYTPQEFTSLQTPRPPGGWAKTPKSKPDPINDPELSDNNELHYPKTPLNLNGRPNGNALDIIGKTPRPPGGWLVTPAPAYVPISTEEISPQKAGLLTPVTSLSKGTGFDPKTPGVPGGWLTTPAARKSILKVRFDPHEPAAQLPGQITVEDHNTYSPETFSSSSRDKSVPLPPSPRSPRKGKTSIRVVDAFGRQQTNADDKESRSMLCVVDPLGREVQPSEPSPSKDTSFGQDLKGSSRSELLARIRHGLDNLAADFDDESMDNDLSASQVQIEELNRVSQKARLARKQLQSQSTSPPLVDLDMKLGQSGIWGNRRRFWLTLLIVQLVLLVLMFRISSHWAKQRYLTSFYDPFNPELYLYASNFDYYSYIMDDGYSRASWFSYARHRFTLDTSIWHDWLRISRDIRSYLWNILTTDPPPRNGSAWLPT